MAPLDDIIAMLPAVIGTIATFFVILRVCDYIGKKESIIDTIKMFYLREVESGIGDLKNSQPRKFDNKGGHLPIINFDQLNASLDNIQDNIEKQVFWSTYLIIAERRLIRGGLCIIPSYVFGTLYFNFAILSDNFLTISVSGIEFSFSLQLIIGFLSIILAIPLIWYFYWTFYYYDKIGNEFINAVKQSGVCEKNEESSKS